MISKQLETNSKGKLIVHNFTLMLYFYFNKLIIITIVLNNVTTIKNPIGPIFHELFLSK